MDKVHTERRRRYMLFKAEKITGGGTILVRTPFYDVDVDFRLGIIKLPEGEFDLTNFMGVAKAIREGFEHYWFGEHPYFKEQGCDTD